MGIVALIGNVAEEEDLSVPKTRVSNSFNVVTRIVNAAVAQVQYDQGIKLECPEGADKEHFGQAVRMRVAALNKRNPEYEYHTRTVDNEIYLECRRPLEGVQAC